MGGRELECLQGYWKVEAEEEVARQSTPETHEGVPSPTCIKTPLTSASGQRWGSGTMRTGWAVAE